MVFKLRITCRNGSGGGDMAKQRLEDYLCGATELNNAKCIGIVAVLTEDFVYLIGDGVMWTFLSS